MSTKKEGFFKSITGALDEVINEVKADIKAMTPPDKQKGPQLSREQQQKAAQIQAVLSQNSSGLAETVMDEAPEIPTEPEAAKPDTELDTEALNKAENQPEKSNKPAPLPTGNLWLALQEESLANRIRADACYHALTPADIRNYRKALQNEKASPLTLGIVAVNLPALTDEDLETKADPDIIVQALYEALDETRLFAAIGAGPRQLWSNPQALDDFLTQTLNDHPKIIAIGPIGLDEPFAPYTLPQQQEQLALQLEIAADFQLPVFLTNRKSHTAMADTLNATKTKLGKLPPLVHFDAIQSKEDYDLARTFGMYLTIRPELTAPDFPHSGAYKSAPLKKLLLASGSALVAPHGHSGHFNQPKFLQNSLAATAKMLSMKELSLAATTNANLTTLFPQITSA
ncbi:MAG: hypothetical protein EBQ80_00900 [Proteobacteria bacterium]|nr:hypothetical protein [Pseudomonadota bacterium]